MTEIKNDYGLDMSKLVNQLRVKAGVMETGERIAWGSDTALMRGAADRIEKLERKLEDIVSELEHMIIKENDRLKAQISATDMQPPDYIDFQTICEALELLSDT